MTLNLAQPSTMTMNAAQNKAALKKVFQTIHWNSCPLSYNFHLHSTFSDGQLRPEQIINQAIRIGLKGLAITDHHSVGGYQVAQKWLNCWQQEHQSQGAYGQNLPHLWTGVEINSDLVGTEVHILGYAFDPEHPSMQPYLKGVFPTGRDYQAKQVIAAIQKAGGLAVLAHPVRYRRSPSELIEAAADLGIDGVETYYAYRNPNPWQPSPQQTEQVKELAEKYDLLSTCGTDTHGSNILLRL
jgi:predicted metal-dependent phosphoesterase TrpH